MTTPTDQPHADSATVARSQQQLLLDAVTVLTDAARTTPDFAEFATYAFAGAAANVGGIEELLAGRPGSWEAHYVREMLTATVGRDEQYLHLHRTEPVVVRVHVDDVLTDLGYADLYYLDTDEELTRRENAIYAATPTELTAEQQAALEELAQLRDRLEAQRRADWTAYGAAFAENVRRVASEAVPGLAVPVDVLVEHEMAQRSGQRRRLPQPGVSALGTRPRPDAVARIRHRPQGLPAPRRHRAGRTRRRPYPAHPPRCQGR